jgi:hypothetical protein
MSFTGLPGLKFQVNIKKQKCLLYAPTKGYLGTPLAEFSTQQLVDGLLYGFGFRIGSNMRCSDSYVTKSFKPDVQTRFDNDHCKKWFPCDSLL